MPYEGLEVVNPEGGTEDAEEEASKGRWKQEVHCCSSVFCVWWRAKVSAGSWFNRMNTVDGFETRYWVFPEHVLDSSASNQLCSAYVHAILCICRMSSDFKLVWDIMMLARKE